MYASPEDTTEGLVAQEAGDGHSPPIYFTTDPLNRKTFLHCPTIRTSLLRKNNVTQTVARKRGVSQEYNRTHLLAVSPRSALPHSPTPSAKVYYLPTSCGYKNYFPSKYSTDQNSNENSHLRDSPAPKHKYNHTTTRPPIPTTTNSSCCGYNHK